MSSKLGPLEWLKFRFSKKATKIDEISTLDLSYVVTVKSTVEISQNVVAFSENVNFSTFSVGGCWGQKMSLL